MDFSNSRVLYIALTAYFTAYIPISIKVHTLEFFFIYYDEQKTVLILGNLYVLDKTDIPWTIFI